MSLGHTISFAMTTRGTDHRVRALLEMVRPHVDEVVLAVDAAGNTDVLEQCGDLADRLMSFDLRGSPARLAGWLQSRCAGDWILLMDDDEVPSPGLIAALPELADERRPLRFEFRRRWLWPDPGHYLTSHPWATDFQSRLVRNLPGAWTFDGRVHTVGEVQGERRYTDHVLYHADLVVSPRAVRWEKATAYENERPGWAIGDFPVNAMYLPESFGELGSAPVPEADRAAIETILGARDRATGGPAAKGRWSSGPLTPRSRVNRGDPIEHSDFCSVDVFNQRRQRRVRHADFDARLTLARAVPPMVAGGTRHLAVAATNLGREPWPRADDSEDPIRLRYRWRGRYALGGWAPFLENVWSGQSSRTLLAVRAPLEPGDHVLELQVVRGARSFGEALTEKVFVAPNDAVGRTWQAVKA